MAPAARPVAIKKAPAKPGGVTGTGHAIVLPTGTGRSITIKGYVPPISLATVAASNPGEPQLWQGLFLSDPRNYAALAGSRATYTGTGKPAPQGIVRRAVNLALARYFTPSASQPPPQGSNSHASPAPSPFASLGITSGGGYPGSSGDGVLSHGPTYSAPPAASDLLGFSNYMAPSGAMISSGIDPGLVDFGSGFDSGGNAPAYTGDSGGNFNYPDPFAAANAPQAQQDLGQVTGQGFATGDSNIGN